MVCFQLEELTKLFGDKQSAALANRLRSENECLRQEIEKKKNELIILEKQHKVPQVSHLLNSTMFIHDYIIFLCWLYVFQILNTSVSNPLKSKQTIPNGDAPTAPAGNNGQYAG